MTNDCAGLIEEHVGRRKGIKGIALRTALGVLKASKPDILHRGVRRLLPDFLTALQPFYDEFRTSGARDFSAFLEERRAQATQALLGIADERVEHTSNSVVRSTYARLRGGAEGDVDALVPGLGRVIGEHMGRS